MLTPRCARFAIAILVSLVFPHGAQGQIGGLIKRKVTDAVKPKEEQAAKATPAEQSPVDFELTPEAMAAFKRGLELEIKMREDFRARVAKLTPLVPKYKACSEGIALRPEAGKLAEEYSSRLDKVKTTADMQKAAEWMQGELQALTKKHCGDDPTPQIPQQHEEFKKAEEAAATEFAKGLTRKPRREEPNEPGEGSTSEIVDGCLEASGPSDIASVPMHLSGECVAAPSPEAGPARTPWLQDVETYLHDYRTTKEFVVKYCSLSPEMRADAEKNGIRVPGQGDKVYWIFSRWFAVWVGPDCDHLIKLYTVLEESAKPAK